jgi:hypothetical protein
MSVLATVIEIEAWLFLAAVGLIVLVRLVRAEINIGQAQLSRMQFLTAAIGFAAYYVSLVVSNTDTLTLPDPGTPIATAFGGSSLVYLINKLVRMWPAITNADRNQ